MNHSMPKHRLPNRFQRTLLRAGVLLLSGLTWCVFQAEVGNRPSTAAEDATTEGAVDDDIPRSQRAMWALERLGEKAVPGDFRFPDHVDAATVYGIDVSRHQGQIDWLPIPQNSVVFAIAKATQGDSWRDPQFASHWAQLATLRDEAMARGHPNFFRGAYHFFSAKVDPLTQAEHFIQVVRQAHPGDLPPTLDIEWDLDCQPCKRAQKTCDPSCGKDRWDDLTRAERMQRVKIWLETVERAFNRTPIIYTSRFFWEDNFGHVPEFARYPLWIADYSFSSRQQEKPVKLPPGFPAWTLWQFTDRGVVKGIKERIDVNRFNGSLYHLAKLAAIEPPLAQGSRGPEVEALQALLVALGYMSADEQRTGADFFGPRTEAALKAFQKDNGLTGHGVVNKETKAALEALKKGLQSGQTHGLVRQVK
jgi:lysozyme